MKTLARALLLLGGLVLALLVGVLIGRGQRTAPAAGNSTTVQINTAPPAPAPEPPPAPAAKAPPPPAPAPAPKAAAIPKIAPEAQVQEDAAAVGMTTVERAPPREANAQPAPNNAVGNESLDTEPPR